MGFASRRGVQGGGERGTRLHESPVKPSHPQEAAQLALGCRRRELGHRFVVLRKGTAAIHVDHMPKVLRRRLNEMAFVWAHHQAIGRQAFKDSL